jgi:hypothetical protein
MASGRAVRGKLRELGRDFVESESNALREHDKRNASQYRAVVSPLAAATAFRRNEPAVLVKAERRRSHSAATSDFTNEQQIIHPSNLSGVGLDFKFTLTCTLNLNQAKHGESGEKNEYID